MDRFALPPVPRLLNRILLVFQGVASLVALTLTFIYPPAAVIFVIGAILTVGLWFKHPLTYAAVMIASFVSITFGLKNGDILTVCSSTLNALAALYIRLNLYELKAPVASDGATD